MRRNQRDRSTARERRLIRKHVRRFVEAYGAKRLQINTGLRYETMRQWEVNDRIPRLDTLLELRKHGLDLDLNTVLRVPR